MQLLIKFIRGKRITHLVFIGLFFLFNTMSVAIGNTNLATLQVNFPGLNNVSMVVHQADGINNSTTGNYLGQLTSLDNGITVDAPQGVYDLIIKKGAGELIVDDVDCRSSTCSVNNIVASLTIHFSGLNGVHSSVRVTDNTNNSATGDVITNKNWQTDIAVIPVLRQIVDLDISKSGSSMIIDDVDCRSGTCVVNNLTAALTVSFPNMSKVNASAHVIDNINNSVTGEKFTSLNSQQDQAVLTVFRQQYDLEVRNSHEVIYVDNVDCRSGTCLVDDLVATMDVNFPGLSGVHSSVRLPDNTDNRAEGTEVANKNWQSDQVQFTLFKKTYDLRISQGDANFIVDNVDCSSGYCLVDNMSTPLTVNFAGISGVSISARVSDNANGTASGVEVNKKSGQNNQANMVLLPGLYDLHITKGDDSIVLDDIDCRSVSCDVNGITAKMTVNFPGLDSMHTMVYKYDGVGGNVTGTTLFQNKWKKDQTVLTVFKKNYDVSVNREKALPLIVDNVDCTSGLCTVDNLLAVMTIKFPGLNKVHMGVTDPDGQLGIANGVLFTKKTGQKDQAELTVLRRNYDVIIIHNNSDRLVLDNLDCTSGSCLVDQITAEMTVNFDGMNGVHTSIFVPDQQSGTVQGDSVTGLNWQTNQAKIPVLKQVYDVVVNRDKSEPVVIDNLDCTSGQCAIDNITANMTVVFSGMSNINTSVQVPDNKLNAVSGNEVTKLFSQTDQAVLTVFKQRYDVQVDHGQLSRVIDNVDCTSGSCTIDGLTAKLDIHFPGLFKVSSSVHLPDSVVNNASGAEVLTSDWKMHNVSYTLLRNIYDVKVNHSVESIFDNVDCTSAECNILISGNVEATLIDGDRNKPIADQFVNAFEKLPDGTLNLQMTGKTTDQGLINFTLPDVLSGKTYVLKVHNPLGNEATFYSSDITNEGAFQFVVTVDGENQPDLTTPEVYISSPQNGGTVAGQGFQVTGTATDNRKIDRLELNISDPVKGSNKVIPVFHDNSSLWEVSVPESMVSADNNITLSVTAFDLAENQSTAEVTVSVLTDNEGPEITITSHAENDNVPVTGFLLSGSISDLSLVDSLKASLVDSTLGETITNQNVEFSDNNGLWTLIVDNAAMQINEEGSGEVSITLNAIDSVGNTSTKTLHLLVDNVDYSATHMINRITFGATPSLITEVENSGALGFLEQQLAPELIENSNFDAMIGGLPGSTEELQAWTLMHMAYSKRQLQEVMTWFWDNHFNTDINTKRNNAHGIETSNTVQYELAENQAFRANALGNFADLLEISAKSPAMLIYLDSNSNVAADSNENYAREVHELHTMGVHGGYTEQDVENGAEIFTGWHIRNNGFGFDGNFHSVGSYVMYEGTLQETVIAEGGVSQGEELLYALATHPSTATFICKKLVTLFVNDTPPESLVFRCADEFLNTADADDQIQQVLRLIMLSGEFNDVANYRAKIKSPIEFVVGAVRNLEATSDATDLISPVSDMGIKLYENSVPTGWSEIGADWINASLLVERKKWINNFVRNEAESGFSYTDPVQFYTSNNYETAEGIVGYLFQLSVGDDYTDLGRNIALGILGMDFDTNSNNAKQQLQKLNGTVLSFPQYQFQ